MTTPTQRSLALLREQGWQVAIVEHWNPHARIRQDLYGFGDILACHPSRGDGLTHWRSIRIIQTTSGSNVSARLAKILAEPRAKVWMESGGEIEVHGWAKRGPRGKAKHWECRTEHITLDMFNKEIK